MTTIQPEVTTERVAVIVFLICKGRRFSTRDVAQLCGVTQRGAYAIMARISRVLPLALLNGEWYEFYPDEETDAAEEHPVPHDVLE